MATVDSKTSASYPSARWQLSYTIGSSNLGKTTVNYSIKSVGRSSSPTILATYCTLTVKDGLGNNLINFTHGNPNSDGIKGEESSFNNKTHKSGSFTVTHDSNGNGSFSVNFSVQFYPRTELDSALTSFNSVTIPTKSYAYTKCSAPTSVTASGIVAPNGEVTVSWSGASGNTSNSISGYDIYWSITREGSVPSTSTYTNKTSISSTSGSGSAKINIGNATRGYTVVFGMVTKGTAGSSYYSGIATGGSVKVNSLPTKPLGGTVSPTLVPASGGTVTFNITPGIDSDGQTVGLKYATSATGTKTTCASSFSLSKVGQGTYYFWSNDGLEDSDEYITISVQKNEKPTITIEVSGPTCETVNILSDAEYVLNPTITLTQGNDGQQNDNTYNYYIHYREKNSTTWTTKVLWEKDSSLVKTINDVRSLGYFTNLAETGYYYYFSATRNDGLDTSDAVNTFSKPYYASKYPSLLGMYNTQDYKDIELSDFQGYFSKALSFKFERDTGYNSLKIFSGATQVGTISLAVTPDDDDLRGQWTNINLTKGPYTFTGELGHAANNFYTSKLELGTSSKIENLEAKNLSASADFQVYIPDLTYDFSIYNTFNTTYDKLNEIYKDYGISDISSSFYARLTVDSAMGKKQPLTIAEQATNGSLTTVDTLYFKLTAEQLYLMLPPEISNKNKTYQGTLTVGFKDVFGNDTSTSTNYTIDYGAIPKVTCSIRVNDNKEVNTWEYLKEGMPLTIDGTVESYNTNPKIQIQINRIKNGVESGYVNFGSPIDLAFNSSSFSNTTPSQGTPTTYTFFNQKIITIGELTELDYQVNFRAKVITDADSKYHYTGSELYLENIKVCGHTSQGAVTLNEADYSSTEVTRATSYLNYRYTNIHPGALTITDNDNKNYKLGLIVELQYRDITESGYSPNNIIKTGLETVEDFKKQSGQKRQTTFSFPENADALVCRLVITTEQTVSNGDEEYITTKTVYTNEQAVYNILPTVSYRKNLLGINATNLNREELKNAVLVIGEHSSKNIIYLVSSTGVKKIDTFTGELDGFIVDCGSW